MKRLFSAKPVIAAAIALAAISASSVMAQSRHDDRRGFAVGEPYGYQQPAPRHPGRDRGPFGDADRDGVPNRFDRDRGGPWGDADRDGIPNRFDRDSRFYDPRAARRSADWGDWDRDGVVNRFDRFPHNPRRS